ncbi:zinc finger protein 62 homolog isoform X6 [Sitophilus oryzae]|uniref:Zinc finger protein 62 homolog isoform X6 n=1 Tax=Sitophilus oryzae TaxID=7048 RepID=A0A6J2XYE8_SITOR|nr:zinc finger protein 62 homolog isoform X6 [Sitophilus oryzae]
MDDIDEVIELKPEDIDLYSTDKPDLIDITSLKVEENLDLAESTIDKLSAISGTTDTALNIKPISVEHIKEENNITDLVSLDIVKQENNVPELPEENINVRSSHINLKLSLHCNRSKEASNEKLIDIVDIKEENDNSDKNLNSTEKIVNLAKELKESQKEIYRCSTCSYKTPHKYSLKKHQKIHLAQEERQLFACPHCDNIYTSKHGLQYHLAHNHIDSRAKALKKSQKKVSRCRCSICSRKTPHNVTFNKHKQIDLPPEERQLEELQKKVHRCSMCSYKTPHNFHLNEHKKIHLPPEERRLFGCAHCDKKYMSKRTLQVHLHIDHTDSRAKGLKESQKKIYRCSICSYQTPYKSYLNAHNNIHLPPEERQLKVYRCSMCSYKTPHNFRLNEHNKIHLAPEERRMFACPHCDKTYTRKQRLRDHLENHHIDLRNPDGTSVTEEVILDSLKIEIDDHTPLKDEFKNTECLIATNQIKSEDLLKLEPDDVAPIQHKGLQDDFKNTECLIATNELKSEDLLKLEPDDVAPIQHKGLQDDFKNTECLIATNQINSEDLLKLEPDDVAPIQHKDLHDDFKAYFRVKTLKKSQKKVARCRCSICSRKTPHNLTLNKHKQIHLPPEERQLKELQRKVYRCSTCSYRTPYKSHLNTHKNIHLPPEKRQLKELRRKVYRCSTCSYRTPYKSHFNTHKNVHLPPKERQLEELQKKVYRCCTCSYQTTNKSNFNSHNKIHLAPEERRMFACPHCDNTYTRRHRLRYHLENHHIDLSHKKIHLAPEERQMFACLHCEKTYTRKQRLQSHLENNHIDSRSRNVDCTSITHEVILDSLKIEIDDNTPLKHEFKNSQCLSVNEVKPFLKVEPDDVAPILHKNLQDDFKNAENLSVAKKVKLEDFIKMEPDDDSVS